MLIQQIIRTDPERILVNVKNVEASSLTTGMGVCLIGGNAGSVTSVDGLSAVLLGTSAQLRPGFVGVAKADIPANSFGLCIAWGYADSVLLSQDTDKTIGVLSGAALLTAGALNGSFTSTLAPEAISTYCGKYIYNVVTTNISSALPYTKGIVRCI